MNFHFDRVLAVYWETLPFVLARMLVYLAAAALTLLWFGWIFHLFLHWPFPGPPFLAWIIGGLVYAGVGKLFRNYVLYLVKAAHVGVITQIATKKELPYGETLFSFSLGIIQRQILRISLFFAVDRMVNLVLKAFNKSVLRRIPVLGGGGNRSFLKTFLDYSVGYVDEAIFSYTLLREGENPWKSAREGLVLYAQNWKIVLGTGLVMSLGGYLLVAAVAFPVGLVLMSVNLPFAAAAVPLAIGAGFLARFIFMDPLALTATIVNFHLAIEGQQANPEWERKMAGLSGEFSAIRTIEGEWRPLEG